MLCLSRVCPQVQSASEFFISKRLSGAPKIGPPECDGPDAVTSVAEAAISIADRFAFHLPANGTARVALFALSASASLPRARLVSRWFAGEGGPNKNRPPIVLNENYRTCPRRDSNPHGLAATGT